MQERNRRVLAAAFSALVAGTLLSCTSTQPQDRPSSADSKRSGLPASPVTDRLATCMEKEGWEVERSLQGGLDLPSVPVDQQSAFEAANSRCSESSGWNAAANLNDVQVKELYDQEVAAHDCFLGMGIDSAQPPSEQRYIETYQTQDQYYAFMPGFDSLNQTKMNEAVKKCPPPTWFLDISGL